MKISAFPKCYLDAISFDKTMSVFDWIKMAEPLGAEGLEMYEGFLWQLDDGYDALLPVMQTDITLTYGHQILIIDAKYYRRTIQTNYG